MSEADIVDAAREVMEQALAAYAANAFDKGRQGVRLMAAVRRAGAMADWDGKFGGVVGRPGLVPDGNLKEAIVSYLTVKKHALRVASDATRGLPKLPGM